MKIKTLMDFLARDAAENRGANAARRSEPGAVPPGTDHQENIVYIDNARVETAGEQRAAAGTALLGTATQWADRLMGEILVSLGKLRAEDINRIVDHQREKGLYFGEAAIELDLVTHDDILVTLSHQFGYSYGNGQTASKDMVMASLPFSGLAEEFRSIRAQLLNDWLSPMQKSLAIVSPGAKEGRSYFAANLASSFAQLGRSTLLIDANLRSPRQHEIFKLTNRIGFSALLAGRVRIEDLDMLPDNVSAFPYLSILNCGAVPPNPAELLSSDRFPAILRGLEQYFDVIIIDSPSAEYGSDVLSIASVAGSALLVARRGYSSLDRAKGLIEMLGKARAVTVGAVLNCY